MCDSEREEGGISSTNIHSSAPPQWGRQLGSSRALFAVELLTPLCRSFCSEMARFRLRPLMAPRCHLQMSPFSISWMCCTMRLMATGKRERAYKHQTILFVYLLKKSPYEDMLTHVVNSSWNDDIYVLLRLGGERKKNLFRKSSAIRLNDLSGRFLYLQAGKTPQKPV